MNEKKVTLSRERTAICGMVTQCGLPCCEKGKGKYCHSKEVCEHQMSADGETRTPAAQRLFARKEAAVLRHAQSISSTREHEREIDNMVDVILKEGI